MMLAKELNPIVEAPLAPPCSALRKTPYANDTGETDYCCRRRSMFKVDGKYLCRSHAQVEALKLLLAKTDLKTPDTQEVELTPVTPDVVYNLAAMAFNPNRQMGTSIDGAHFRWIETPEGGTYWVREHSRLTQEGRDKIRAMREQLDKENA